QELSSIIVFFRENYNHQTFRDYKDLSLIAIKDLSEIHNMVLVEKHLISPYLAKSSQSGVLLSVNEQVSIMLNEEDHIRMQLYVTWFQLETALKETFLFDDRLEEDINYASDEEIGNLTSCPTNVG